MVGTLRNMRGWVLRCARASATTCRFSIYGEGHGDRGPEMAWLCEFVADVRACLGRTVDFALRVSVDDVRSEFGGLTDRECLRRVTSTWRLCYVTTHVMPL